MAAGSHDPLTNSFAAFFRDKRSLAAVVRDVGRVSVMDSVDLVLDICDELANAHANGIVHGDLGLHRVRTMWPRVPGDSVDIFALDADDTGAIDFRAAFQTPAQAPEQRAGRVGDQRSDIWAVGAILHALVGGAPPSKRPVREVLTGAPHALITCVEQCLAENPAARPQSVDDVAAALASFSSTPPERFQQLARRRIASIKAKHVSEKVSTLGKLDDAAVKRASVDRIFAVSSLSGVRAMPVADPIIDAAPVSRPTSRHSYDDIAVSFEWPTVHQPHQPHQAHQAPSASIMMDEPPTAAAPRETLPPIGPAPIPRDAVRQATQPVMQEFSGFPEQPVRERRTTTPMFHPWLQHPSMAPPPMPMRQPIPTPVYEAPARPASSFRAAPVTGSHSMFPAAALAAPVYPGTATNVANASPVYPGTATNVARPRISTIPPPMAAAPRFRMPSQPSYHPPSLGPVVVDSADSNGIRIPPAARVPSFSDLEQYRQAKRASRRSATFAVLVAAAVLILGFGLGSRVLERDRAAMHAASAQNQVAATQAPAAATTVIPAPPAPVAKNATPDVAATPIAALPTASAPVASASSITALPTAPATTTAKPKRHHGSHAAATYASPAPTGSQDDRPDTASTSALTDALGKKEAAPANALEGALK